MWGRDVRVAPWADSASILCRPVDDAHGEQPSRNVCGGNVRRHHTTGLGRPATPQQVVGRPERERARRLITTQWVDIAHLAAPRHGDPAAVSPEIAHCAHAASIVTLAWASLVAGASTAYREACRARMTSALAQRRRHAGMAQAQTPQLPLEIEGHVGRQRRRLAKTGMDSDRGDMQPQTERDGQTEEPLKRLIGVSLKMGGQGGGRQQRSIALDTCGGGWAGVRGRSVGRARCARARAQAGAVGRAGGCARVWARRARARQSTGGRPKLAALNGKNMYPPIVAVSGPHFQLRPHCGTST